MGTIKNDSKKKEGVLNPSPKGRHICPDLGLFSSHGVSALSEAMVHNDFTRPCHSSQ